MEILKRRASFTGTKFGGGESEGGAGIHFPHTPFSSRPARAFRFGFCRAKRGNQSGFCSKKVRASFSNCDQTRFVKFERRDAAFATRTIILSDGLIVSDKKSGTIYPYVSELMHVIKI